MYFKLIFFLSAFSYLTLHAKAQEDQEVRAITSALADALPEEGNLSELVERLSYYKTHKIELNTAKPEQLKELMFLSPLQINNLFSHIQTNGKLIDLLELQSIAGFDIITIEKLLPYITLKSVTAYDQLSLKQALSKGNNELVSRYAQILEKQKGYNLLPGSHYLGSPQKFLLKYRYNLEEVAAASFVMKKDAGESFFKGINKYGFDFISGNMVFYKAWKFNRLVFGDYSLQFGQGLTIWSGLSFGKGADVAGVAKKDTGLKPYTSTGEYSFFRGIAGAIKLFRNIDLTSFISLKNLDASLTADSSGNYTLANINESGLHRTSNEIANKGDLRLLFYGSALQYNKNSLGLGLIITHSLYQHDFVTGNQLYNKYSFTGKGLTNIGIHYNYTFRNTYFFGETARSIPGGLAVLNGVLTSLSPMVSVVILYRNYAKNHINFYSQGIGENTDMMNEKGIYTGINIYPNHKWTLSFYMDSFHFPWLKYRVDAPSYGNEVMGQLSYTPIKYFKAQLKYRNRITEQNGNTNLNFNSILKVKIENYRLEVSWKVNRKISLQNRAEITRYRKEKTGMEFGYLVYQDMDYKPLSSALTANIRLAWFYTASYNSRIYAYEDDVLYGSGSGLYNGKGVRAYLNLKYRLSRKVDIWTRYAISYYPGQPVIGSGLDEITGSKKSDIKIQLRYQF